MLRILFLIFLISFTAKAQETIFEKSGGKETGTYNEVIEYYQNLAAQHPRVTKLMEMGLTDSGEKLHLLIIDQSGSFDLPKLQASGKTIVLFNNGIHPGEPDGIEASMMLARNLLSEKENNAFWKNTVLCIIPLYNIGGALNRNSTSRVNQNGPVAYGFRGNARNFDLNRDFIKADTRNAFAFYEIFHMVNPDVFIDTHVSNGADYQYPITHLATQHNRIGSPMGSYIHDEFTPELERLMEASGNLITPYVNVFNRTPDERGFSQFMDAPRYSTGYTALFGTLGFMIETHMLKPFDVRVRASYEFLKNVLEIVEQDGKKIQELRKKTISGLVPGTLHPIDWKLDESKSRKIMFAGFEGKMQKSEVTGLERLKYDRDKPFEKEIPYFDTFIPSKEIIVPAAYIVPQGWHQVIERLIANGAVYTRLLRDSVMAVESYRINEVSSAGSPYEGHFPHRSMSVSRYENPVSFRAGDYIFPVSQKAGRYIVETLEPEATDSFFRWNFFDTILQQKEGFSPYVFEDLALKILEENPSLNSEFQKKKSEEPEFAENWYAQLNYIYEHSDYHEKAFMQYPVYRILR